MLGTLGCHCILVASYLDWEWAYGPSSQGLDEADATEFAGRAE